MNNIRITLINAGMVKTPFFNELNFSHGDESKHYLLPEDISDAVNYVLNSRPEMNIDEINLNPMQKVIKFK